MPQTIKNIGLFLDALEDILNGCPVYDLEERITAIDFSVLKSAQEIMKISYAIAGSRYENKILQGEDLKQVYGGDDIQEYLDLVNKIMNLVLLKYKAIP